MAPPSDLSLALDRDSEEPLYHQLIRHIRSQITSGGLPAGTRLPASRDLARTLGLSRISVVNAYAELRAQGYLSAHAGRGTFVARPSGLADATPPTQDAPTRERGVARNGHSAPPQDRAARELMRLARKPDVINLSHGAPPPEFLPLGRLREALNAVLDRDGAAALTYESPEGYAPLRAAVRDYVASWGIQASAQQVIITGGAQQALDLAVQTLLAPGDVIVTENPTFLGMMDIARARRVQVVGLPMDANGIRMDALETVLLEQRPRLIYVIPSFHNPTGRVMPLHRRRQLVALAAEYDVPVVEDNVYHDFRFEGDHLPPLMALDEHGLVLHVSSFTKALLPGLRIGYLIAPPPLMERMARLKQSADISTPGLNQRAIHHMLVRGVLAQQLARNVLALRQRRDAVLDAAERHLPPGSTWHRPEGGMFLWVTLPRSGPTASELYVAALQAQVSFAIGTLFHTDGGGSYTLRLNYSQQPPELIHEGMRRLGRAWRDLAVDTADLEKSPLL